MKFSYVHVFRFSFAFPFLYLVEGDIVIKNGNILRLWSYNSAVSEGRFVSITGDAAPGGK